MRTFQAHRITCLRYKKKHISECFFINDRRAIKCIADLPHVKFIFNPFPLRMLFEDTHTHTRSNLRIWQSTSSLRSINLIRKTKVDRRFRYLLKFYLFSVDQLYGKFRDYRITCFSLYTIQKIMEFQQINVYQCSTCNSNGHLKHICNPPPPPCYLNTHAAQ